MSVTTKKYTRKNAKTGELFRAIRVSARNFLNVAVWSKGEALQKNAPGGDVSNQRVKVKGLVAQIGDFVVKDEEGNFFRIKDDVFEAEYKLKV